VSGTGWIYRFVFESGAPVMVLDAHDLKVIAANPQVAELTGIPLEQILGHPPDFLKQADPNVEPDWRRHQSAVLLDSQDNEQQVEVTVLCMENVPRPAVVLRIDVVDTKESTPPSPLESKHAALQRAHHQLQMAYNQHELLIDELNAKNHELKQVYRRLSYASKMATIGELAAGTTHGINNPLAAAVSANRQITALAADIEVSEIRQRLESLCSRTDTALKRIERIVSDLRSLAQAGSRRDDIKEVELFKEMDLAVDLLKHRLKGVALQMDIPHDIKVRVAPDEFMQVVMNLVDNAVYATGGDGSIKISATDDGRNVRIKFEDDGEGIPADIVDKIFDPFFSTKSPGQGSGIGLNVARSIIESYAGTIEVSSRQGRGCTFTIQLPAEEYHEE